MRIIDRGVVNSGSPGGPRAVSTFPAVTVLPSGELLAFYRVGSTKDCDDQGIELRRSSDGGYSWSEPTSPFESHVEGRRGTLSVAYATLLADDHLIVAAMWIDREAYPGKPLFNAETEGCLPMKILLADSRDGGATWTPWRVVATPPDVGPPSLTNPILKLPSGRLALSIETNKEYEDASTWFQRVVYFYSDDLGRSWGPPHTVAQDPEARIFYWDQRAGVLPDGRIATYSWTYDRSAGKYINIHRMLSRDEGATWSTPEDLGFTDQAAHPAVLPDGRVVLAWVDRFGTRSIRARLAADGAGAFTEDSEVVLYEFDGSASGADRRTTGELLSDMGVWNFGLPYAEALPDGDVIVLFYAGTATHMEARWAHLGP